MSKVTRAAKRILVGRAVRSDRLAHTLLPKRIALPIFASDALSSVAYAPQEIFIVLSVAGLAAYGYAPWIAITVALVMVVVVWSYRQNVHAYPSGGGDYEVATKNLGQRAGLLVGSALLVDYILTVAVSTAAGVANIGSAIDVVGDHHVLFSVLIIVIISAANLRGIRESGAAFAIPTYAFILAVFAMVITGLVRWISGSQMRAESADFDIVATHSLSGLALIFLLARAFSSGSAALTGVEAISNGVPAFKKPKSKNAATTLALMGGMAVTMLLGIVALALITKVRITEDPSLLIGAPEGYRPKTMIAQIAQSVFSGFPVAFYIVSFTTGFILILASNTAFNGFPVLGSILAQDRFLPRQLHTRGDRLAFSNGIVFLGAVAIFLVIIFKADVTALIQLYIVGVFISFTTSQGGMIKHWNRLLARTKDPAERRRYHRARLVSGTGFVLTGAVLIIVLITKFLSGAWITIVAIAGIYALMVAIRKHYDRVALEIAADEDDLVLPSRIHAIVLVSKLHLPTMRALSYARATRPDTLEAVTVNVDPADTAALAREWEDRELPVPLKVIDSPFREITKPVLDYVRRVRKDAPRDVVAVFLPEYVVGHWWEQILHNQSALRLKGRLLFTPGVMVTSVPWQMSNLEAIEERLQAKSERQLPLYGRRLGVDSSDDEQFGLDR
ncbi:APC family permease [Nakamurella silvestris]|nr:APC family permease [Nakamurella silvestris]